jgi:hypothetical protein
MNPLPGQRLRGANHRGRPHDGVMLRQPSAGASDGHSAPETCISLSPRRIIYALGLVIVMLTSAHIILMVLYALDPPTDASRLSAVRFFSTLFDLNGEANPPAWYSSFLLLVSAALLSVIAFDKRRQQDRDARHWMVLALVFFYLSIDEGSRLHDRTVEPLRSLLSLGGMFYYSWVIMAIPALLLFGAWYLRFFLRLPRRFQIQFSVAAATYIGGALGVEIITGYYDQLRGGVGRTDIVFVLLVALEETAEMVGVLVFIHALLSYLRLHVGGVRLHFGDGRTRDDGMQLG